MSKFVQISIFVILGHLGVLGSAYLHSWSVAPMHVEPKKMTVQTISLIAQAPTPPPTTPPPTPPAKPTQKPLHSHSNAHDAPKKVLPKQEVKSHPVKKTPPAKPKKVPVRPKKPEKKPPPAPVSNPHTPLQTSAEEPKKEAQKPLAPVETSALEPKKEVAAQILLAARDKISKIQFNEKNAASVESISQLSKVDALQIDQLQSNSNGEEVTYQEELAYYLKQKLHLIEKGDVKVKLTLNRKGAVQDMQVLYAESRLNRELIEKEIPPLLFPTWEHRFKSRDVYTCSITLSHD